MSMLTNKFAYGSKREIVSTNGRPLTEDQMRGVAPAIFAQEAHESRSARYTYIPTIDVLRGLQQEGFEPFSVTTALSRIAGKTPFTKHMIRLRMASMLNQGGSAELVMINSHDGTSKYQLLGGWFEFLCSNGLVRGEKAGDVRVAHKGDITAHVVQGAHALMADMRHLGEVREMWRGTALSQDERHIFAEAALQLRYDEGKEVVRPEQLLYARRREESGRSDIWTTFNVVQENVVRGGQQGRTADHRRVTTREVRGIDQKVGLNRALWTLTEKMAELKGVAA